MPEHASRFAEHPNSNSESLREQASKLQSTINFSLLKLRCPAYVWQLLGGEPIYGRAQGADVKRLCQHDVYIHALIRIANILRKLRR
jgi:hypothetical protein